MQRALCEGRERAHLLDLVAEELHPQRLAAGGREDIDDAAADRELAALLDALHSRVPGERELPGEAAAPRLVADPQPDRLRTLGERRQRIGQRTSRGAHETSTGEDVESAETLTDEMGRRLEPGAVSDAATGEQCDLVLPDVPGDGVGRVPGVRILGQEHEQRPAELSMQRGKKKWQNRLRDSRARGQRVGETSKALVCGELGDEG